ncbi:MAG: undecaprenyl-diphosphate phosphatase [Oscillospiraceae bacterium]
MGILEALLQGILQGLTEFLPVSSSGHLSLFQRFFLPDGQSSLFFTMMLHLGTLAAVIAAFYEDIWRLIKELGFCIRDIFTGRFSLKTQDPYRKLLYMLVLATLPMVLIVPIRGMVSGMAEDKDIVAEGIFFLITGALLYFATRVKPGRAGIGKMKPKHALILGIVQDFAVFPGLSRSGSTISAGMIMGFERAFMVKFSFLMSIPVILGGAVFEIGDAVKAENTVGAWPMFLGMLAAAVFGYLSIQLIKWLLLSDKFVVFAWYTLILGAICVVVGIILHIVAAASGDASAVSSLVSSVTSGASNPSSVASSIAQSVSSVASAA